MTCARCGCGVFKAEDQIIMNKVWHKCCFRCSRCNRILDKFSAKLFQGEIFCECCHSVAIEDFESLIKPCRVVSSPSCICIKRESEYISKTPSFDYSKKYDICFPPDFRNNLPRNIQSCSCIPDVKTKPYCFAFPIPREVANYYNRLGMRKRSRYLSQKPYSNENLQKNPSIKVRDMTPPRKECSPVRRHCSRQDSPQRCPKYKCCACTECPRQSCCPCPRQNSVHSRDYSPCRCKDCCRSCSSRRCFSPKRKSSCGCCRRSESRDRVPPPSHPHHIKNSHYQEPERIHHSERVHYLENCRYSESPRHSESPAYVQNCCCYKKWPCCKDRPRSSTDYPRPSCPYATETYSCRYEKHGKSCRCEKPKKNCVCGKPNPCDCKMNQIRSECTSICVRCGCKVYAAEKICVSGGPYHTSCFSCVCCHKLLDVKNVYENAGEIYCKHCYNSLLGNSYYGYS